MYALETDGKQQQQQPPPGQFVSQELERDCARFLEELRRRATLTKGIGVPSEK
jgi:hypothetical protein